MDELRLWMDNFPSDKKAIRKYVEDVLVVYLERNMICFKRNTHFK